jgi:LytS/YehU family sensor histidine kinase
MDAAKYLSSFARITRSVLEGSRMELISVEKEVELLNNYLQLQKLRFGDRFDYRIDVQPGLDTNMLIPPMLSQPFIENALEHGMRDIESGGLILVNMAVKEDRLVLEIKDNGQGLSQTPEPKRIHQSLATAITRERIKLMNRKQSAKIIFTIEDAYPDQVHKGVKVSFSIPI